MAKVRTFATRYPKKHTNEGQPTFFVEKILKSLDVDYFLNEAYLSRLIDLNERNIKSGKLNYKDLENFWFKLITPLHDVPKHHTCRNGFSIIEGEKISPRIWSDKPYDSAQIIFHEPIKVVKTYKLEIEFGDGVSHAFVNHSRVDKEKIALNDGLTIENFDSWFNKPFCGQIICWNKIEY
jgi:hypothetical protein